MPDNLTADDVTPLKPRVPKLSAEKALPVSPSETLMKIIKGYAVASGGGSTAINYKDVAAVTNLSPTLVSANNSFLAESGFIQSPKYGFYLPSEEAVRFARETAWGEEKAKVYLRRIAFATWYGTVIDQVLSLRSSVPRDDLKRSLAIKCGASEGDSASLEKLIDFVRDIALVAEGANGLFERGDTDNLDVTTESVPPAQTPASPSLSSKAPVAVVETTQQPRGVSVVLHLHVRDWSELSPENAVRLRDWLASMDANRISVNVEQPNSA